MSTLNLTRVGTRYRQKPNQYKVFKLSKVRVCWDPWVYIEVFKNTALWLSFYSDPGRIFRNWRHMHISAYADTCQHYTKGDVYVGSLQSTGSHLWKFVAGKDDEGSDLWPSAPHRTTSSSSEVCLLRINTLQFNSLITSVWWAFSLSQATPQVKALS